MLARWRGPICTYQSCQSRTDLSANPTSRSGKDLIGIFRFRKEAELREVRLPVELGGLPQPIFGLTSPIPVRYDRSQQLHHPLPGGDVMILGKQDNVSLRSRHSRRSQLRIGAPRNRTDEVNGAVSFLKPPQLGPVAAACHHDFDAVLAARRKQEGEAGFQHESVTR